MDISKALLVRIKQGDKEAFAQLYRAYHPRICSFLYGLLQNSGLAEEITQDVFFRLWLNKEKIDPDMAFNSYLYSIAKNTVVNFYKKKAAEQKFLLAKREEEAVSETEEKLYYKELQGLINAVVESMPYQQRTVFRMSREEGLLNAEIASKLNISKRTVEKHISNSISTLRKVIEKNQFL
ncbi:MAG: RNA polymerase sigma-70 factor, partial [Tannerellaceae bacterium]